MLKVFDQHWRRRAAKPTDEVVFVFVGMRGHRSLKLSDGRQWLIAINDVDDAELDDERECIHQEVIRCIAHRCSEPSEDPDRESGPADERPQDPIDGGQGDSSTSCPTATTLLH
jgi:hypothetical protein